MVERPFCAQIPDWQRSRHHRGQRWGRRGHPLQDLSQRRWPTPSAVGQVDVSRSKAAQRYSQFWAAVHHWMMLTEYVALQFETPLAAVQILIGRTPGPTVSVAFDVTLKPPVFDAML